MASASQISDFLRAEFPGNTLTIEHAGDRKALIRKPVTKADLRPGGTVSGPCMMGVADTALYVAILAEIGLVALAVTTNLSINFLRRPRADADVLGDCKLIKVGQKLIVGEVTLYSDGEPDAIAHAVGTYAIPPNKP